MTQPTAPRRVPTRRVPTWIAAPLVCAALLSACTGADTDDASGTASPTTAATTASPSATTAPPTAAATEIPRGDGGPEASFLTWLAASRAPDTATACAYMTPALTQRMVDEITAQGLPGVTDCTTLITMSAQLFAAAGQSSEPAVEVREQTEDRAVLDVTYAEGSCGSVVLRPGDGHWLLDERSRQEC